MANAGADVIKVEPPGGEFLRRRDARPGSSIPFTMLNCNKRSISLNLKHERGVELFLELADEADVILENFVPGVVNRLGIDYETVCARNPRIVYASGSGYGQDGLYRDYPAMDLTVQAMSGVMSATGFPDQPPVKAGAAICDFFGGTHLFGAVMTALFYRERSGEGSRVEVAMLDSVYPTLASNIGGIYGEREDLPSRTGNQHGGLSLCPYNVFKASDGYIAIICNHEGHWQALTKAMGRPDLSTSTDYDSVAKRVANMEVVDGFIESWTRKHDREWLFDQLINNGVPCAPVRELRETMADPHLHQRGMLLEVDHPTFGSVTVCRSPIRFDGRPPPAYITPPTYGQHNASVYAERLGLDEETLTALAADGVL
jgi:CoA:oxalate CoA-transferase